MKTTLLASAPSKDAIEECIRKFYCGESKTLVPTGENEWKLVSTYNGNDVANARVIRKRNRFRFEMIR